MRATAGQLWRRVRHFGMRHYCVLCRSHLRAFLPHGNPVRLNSVCPVCFSRERHRLAWLYMYEQLASCEKACRVLHLAPEPSIAHRIRGLDRVEYVSGDIRALEGVRLDVQALPFRDQCFDFIYCSHVLNMVQDDVAALREVGRVLRNGGLAVIQVPLSLVPQTISADAGWSIQQRTETFDDADMWHRYGRDVLDRFHRSGLSVARVAYADSIAQAEFDRFGLIHEDLLLCRVTAHFRSPHQATQSSALA